LQRRFTSWWVIPVLLIAFWLGARELDAKVVWADEVITLRHIGAAFYGPLSPFGIWERVGTHDAWQAPGYFMLLNGWGRVTGWEPAGLRAMSLMFGVLSIAWTYRLGSDIASRRMGLYAAAILAISPFFVYYMQEMRVYTLFTFLSVAEIWIYLRIVRSRRELSLMWWLALLGGMVALLYIHYFAILPLAAIGLYHLMVVPKNQNWWKVVGVTILAGVLFLPWVRYVFAGLALNAQRESLHERALSTGDALFQFARLFSNGSIVLLLILGTLSLWVVFRRERGARVVAFFAFVLLALLLGANEILRVMHGGRLRYLIVLWPLFALLIAIGINGLRQRKLLAEVALGVWMALGVWNTFMIDFTVGLDGSNYIYPMHLIARSLSRLQQPQDVVVNYLPDAGVESDHYEQIASFYYTPINLEYLLVQTRANPREWIAAEQKHMLLLQPRDRVWLAYMPDQVSSTLADFEAELIATFVECQPTLTGRHVTIKLFARSSDLCSL
jgi:hypothetical protein